MTMAALGEMALVAPSRRRGRPAVALVLSLALHGAAFAGFLAWNHPAPEETIMVVSLVGDWAEAIPETEFSDAVPTAGLPEPGAPIALPLSVPQLATEPEILDPPNQEFSPVPPTEPILAPSPAEAYPEPETTPHIVTSVNDLPAAMPALPVVQPDDLAPASREPETVEVITADPTPPPKRPRPRRQVEHAAQATPARVSYPAVVESKTAPSASPIAQAAGSAAPRHVEPLTPPASATTAIAAAPVTERSTSALPDSYRRALLRWLERRTFYPPAARRAGLEGQVVLRIRLGRDGTVIETALAGSSGHAVLDEAALDLVGRAGDAPPLPADFPADQAELVAPLSFLLK